MSSPSSGNEQSHFNGFTSTDLEQIINSSQDFIVSLGLDYTIKYANNAYCDMARKAYSKEIAYHQTLFFDLIPHFLHAHYKELLANVVAGETISNDTYRNYSNKNLSDAYFEEVFKPVVGAENAIQSISVFIKDITQKYRIEHQLAENEAILRGVFDSSSDEILSINTKYEVTSFNTCVEATYTKITGKKINIGTNILKYFDSQGHYQLASTFKQRYDRGLKGEKFSETDTYELDGVNLYRELFINPIVVNNSIIGISIFGRDITQKIHNEKRAIENEEFLKSVQNMAQIGTWRHNLKSVDFSCSNYCFEIFGVMPTVKPTKELFDGMLGTENKQKIQNAISKFLINGKRESFEITLAFSANVVKHLACNINPIFDSENNLVEYIGSIQNITDRKNIELSLASSLEEAEKLNETLSQREKELTSNEEELRTYVEELSLLNRKLESNEALLNKNLQLLNLSGLLSKLGGWEYDVAEDKYYLTDQMYLMRGLKIGDELNFKNTLDFYTLDDAAILQNKLDRLMVNGDPYDHEMQMNTLSGDKIWVRSIGYAEMKKGKVVKAYGAVQDITKRKRDQQKLVDSEANLKAIINNTDFGIWAIDKEYRLIAFNDVFEREYAPYSNVSPKVGMNLFTNNHSKKEIEDMKKYYERAFNGEKFNVEIDIFDFTFESYFNPITQSDGSIRGVAVINKDISSRKVIEKQIKSSEHKFRALFEKSKVSMMLIDRENVIDCNEQTLKLFQISDKTELNKLIPPLLKDSGFEGFSLINNNNKPSTAGLKEQIFEWTHTLKDGDRLYGEIRITPVEIDNREVLFSQFYDLTERKSAEVKILESENFLNSIIDNIPIGIMIINKLGEVKRMNSALIALTGIPENWFTRGGINFSNDPFLEEIGAKEMFKTALKGGVVINEELKIDFGLSINEWNMRDDIAWFLVTAFPIEENKSINNVVVALIDITVDKQNEEKIRHNATELITSNKKMAEYKLMALRSVMNPHFLFNSLNSIQYFIAKNEREQALNYLSLFSKLIRSILNSSIDNSHSLVEEISILRFYTDLETLRFENKFKTIFEIDEEIDQESIEIPSLILQPYVENAILHGLYNKEGEQGVLLISFKLTDDENLMVVIEDNGVGRIEALEIKQASKIHRSVGMLVTQERLELINKDNNLTVKIIDLKDESGNPKGTRVEVQFNI